jgi:chromosome segregation ATPase
MEKYLSIAEFSKIIGQTPQSLYPRLQGDLEGFVKVIKGRKTLDIAALELFDIVIEKEVKPEDEIIERLENELRQEKEKNQSLSGELRYFKDLLKNQEGNFKVFKEQVEVLSKQLEVKDNQINSLNEHLMFTNRLSVADKMKTIAEDTDQDVVKTKKWYQFWL